MEPATAYKSSRAIPGFRCRSPITSGVKLFFHGVYCRAGDGNPAGFGTAVSLFMPVGETSSTAIGIAESSPVIFAASCNAAATFAIIGSPWTGGVTGAGSWRAGTRAVLLRRAFLRGNWRLSQSRSASAEMSTPRPRNAVARTSTESPSRRSRRSSSRCGSSCAVFGCRAWRAFAASSASVSGVPGAISWCACGSEVVIRERYSERLWSAMGVGLDQSKPRGLDVGVLHYAFLLYFVVSLRSRRLLPSLLFLSHRLKGVICSEIAVLDPGLRFCFSVVMNFVGWVDVLMRRFGCSISCPVSSLEWCGGGAC